MDEFNAKRLIVLVDMDCFYCQVEVQHNQSLIGKPVAVVQYNSWRGGGIIAVNYEARAKGVGRHMRGDDALKTCPDLNLVRVKELHGKADLSKYREASQKVFDVLSEFCPCVQRASIDEAYLDLTSAVNNYVISNRNKVITESDLPNTYIEGYSDDKSSTEGNSKYIKSWLNDVYNNELQDENLLHLTIAAMMVENLRQSIFLKTGFRCSAGIANNKILAKLACGLHKPNQQTLLPPSSIPHLFRSVPLKKVRNLGGKLGIRVAQEFECVFMSDLAIIPLDILRQKFDDKTSHFLYQVSRGIDNEPVESRLIPKSIGSCKSFPLGLKVKNDVNHWVCTLIDDVVDKLEADLKTNKRRATSMTVSVRYQNRDTSLPTSHCGEVTTYNRDKLLNTAHTLLYSMTDNQKSSINWKNPLTLIGLAIGKFKEMKEGKSLINNYFNKATAVETKQTNDINSTALDCKQPIHSETYVDKINKNDCLVLTQVFEKPKEIYQPSTISKSNDSITNNEKLNSEKSEKINETNNIHQESQQYKLKSTSQLGGFFFKKLESIPPIKPHKTGEFSLTEFNKTNHEDNNTYKSDKVTSEDKKELYDSHSIKQPFATGVFLKKLDYVSPSKQVIRDDLSIEENSVVETAIEDNPFKLSCDRCNKLIDIEEYDEHLDHHIALELSKQLNSVENVNKIAKIDGLHKSPNKTVNNNRKRKLGIPKSPKTKKSCTKNISSYFKPVGT
ncbi:DNA polymerase eta-like [Adelges cooleyi]|uniref:DNA polymerase eta-like n=1 Tax=Adelges cooleyi TaxID=133065 RepID=UPI00217F33C3|nr:DNA polymerase eta-like [Adelges cooleyi]